MKSRRIFQMLHPSVLLRLAKEEIQMKGKSNKGRDKERGREGERERQRDTERERQGQRQR